jgi:hypothetical protein
LRHDPWSRKLHELFNEFKQSGRHSWLKVEPKEGYRFSILNLTGDEKKPK